MQGETSHSKVSTPSKEQNEVTQLKDPQLVKPKGRPTDKYNAGRTKYNVQKDWPNSRVKPIVQQFKGKLVMRCSHSGERGHNIKKCTSLHIQFDAAAIKRKKEEEKKGKN